MATQVTAVTQFARTVSIPVGEIQEAAKIGGYTVGDQIDATAAQYIHRLIQERKPEEQSLKVVALRLKSSSSSSTPKGAGGAQAPSGQSQSFEAQIPTFSPLEDGVKGLREVMAQQKGQMAIATVVQELDLLRQQERVKEEFHKAVHVYMTQGNLPDNHLLQTAVIEAANILWRLNSPQHRFNVFDLQEATLTLGIDDAGSEDEGLLESAFAMLGGQHVNMIGGGQTRKQLAAG